MTTLSGTTDNAVLMALNDYPAGMTMAQLLSKTCLNHGWVSMAVCRLQIGEYITKKDGLYKLTQSGRDYVAHWSINESN